MGFYQFFKLMFILVLIIYSKKMISAELHHGHHGNFQLQGRL